MWRAWAARYGICMAIRSNLPTQGWQAWLPTNPSDRRRAYVLWSAAAALVAALLVSSQIQWSMKGHGHDWWRLFLWQLSGWGFWAVVGGYLISRGERLAQASTHRRQELLANLGLSVVLVTVQVAAVAWVFMSLQPFQPIDTYAYSESLGRAISTWFIIDFLIYGMALTIGYGLASYRLARRAEVREARLEAELARAQLETLRLQLQPHFLFNSLHSIAALVRRRQNDRALDMLLGLSDLLRATLDISARSCISLQEELEFLRLYVDLQKTRFADRLSVSFDVSEDCLQVPVPALLLQPLAENAIRHGIAPRAAPGYLEIGARHVGDAVLLWVRDDGVGLRDDFEVQHHAGVGLGNARSRLQQIYDGQAKLEVLRRPKGGTAVELRLPVDPEVGGVANHGEPAFLPQAKAS